MAKHVYRHTITAAFAFDREYDPTKPETLLDILQEINSIRKAITEIGGVVAKDSGRPVVVKE